MDEINNPVLYNICKASQVNTIKAVNVLAAVILGIGLIGGLILIIIGLVSNTEHYGYSPDWIVLGCGVAAMLNSAIVWAVLKMLIAIYSKLDKQ